MLKFFWNEKNAIVIPTLLDEGNVCRVRKSGFIYSLETLKNDKWVTYRFTLSIKVMRQFEWEYCS